MIIFVWAYTIQYLSGGSSWIFEPCPSLQSGEITVSSGKSFDSEDFPITESHGIFLNFADFSHWKMGMSENGVYPQWNSHLVGIMISKTIGYNGVLTIFRQTQMGKPAISGWLSLFFGWILLIFPIENLWIFPFLDDCPYFFGGSSPAFRPKPSLKGAGRRLSVVGVSDWSAAASTERPLCWMQEISEQLLAGGSGVNMKKKDGLVGGEEPHTDTNII